MWTHSFICVAANLHQARKTDQFIPSFKSFVFDAKAKPKKYFSKPSLIFNFIGNYQLEPYPYLDTNSLTSFIIAATQHLPWDTKRTQQHRSTPANLNIDPMCVCYHSNDLQRRIYLWNFFGINFFSFLTLTNYNICIFLSNTLGALIPSVFCFTAA